MRIQRARRVLWRYGDEQETHAPLAVKRKNLRVRPLRSNYDARVPRGPESPIGDGRERQLT
jgi:hypothetical protein